MIKTMPNKPLLNIYFKRMKYKGENERQKKIYKKHETKIGVHTLSMYAIKLRVKALST